MSIHFPLEQGTRWIQVNYVPDFDEYGTVRAIVVMSHDITEQKKTELLFTAGQRRCRSGQSR